MDNKLIDYRYHIIKKLGGANTGIVFLAKDVGLGRTVVLKMLESGHVRDPEALRRFAQELRAMAAASNDHLVQAYASGWYYLVMEYVCGQTLKQIIRDHRRRHVTIPVRRTMTILGQIAEGIDALHLAGHLHLDIKPSNLIIEQATGRPVVIDFGMSTLNVGLESYFFGGTPNYMAPEQTSFAVAGSQLTPQTDVYGLGCTAFEVLTGQTPFFGAKNATDLMRHHCKSIPPTVSSLRPELTMFDSVIARALAKTPADRYATCLEFVNALFYAAQPRFEMPLSGIRDNRLQALVVTGDHGFQRRMIRAMMHTCAKPVCVVTADSLHDARTMIQQRAWDIIFWNDELLGTTGLDVLSDVRATPWGHRTRIVLLSDLLGEEQKCQFSVFGVGEIMKKPPELDTLLDELQPIIERSGW